ncbi:MAG TPA: CpaD family pilus assembly lipoprotein [Allosphingosinicella sp.]|jgi:pilus assembly protein CpaD|nr:CpaD family pilus assembly lipoprotein [Allosphingosinicella sp.]
MARTRATAALLFLGAAVSACASGSTSPGSANRVANMSLYSVNQPVVQRTDYVIDLATGPEGVPATEIGRLHGWFEGLQIGYGDRIAVDEPAGGYSDGTVRESVAEAAGRYGLLVENGAPMTSGEVQPGTVRVVLSRTTASVPNCPNWERTGLSATSANYGCATNSNLAAMIADPNDLVLGQTGSGTADPAATSRAIRSYRDAAPTGTRGLQQTPTNGGR